MTRVVHGSKFLGEVLALPFDFLSQLAVGETISSKSAVATVYSGTDATPSAIIVSSAIVGTQVVVQVTGGVVGVIYQLLVSAGTSAGHNPQLSAYLAVVPDLP